MPFSFFPFFVFSEIRFGMECQSAVVRVSMATGYRAFWVIGHQQSVLLAVGKVLFNLGVRCVLIWCINFPCMRCKTICHFAVLPHVTCHTHTVSTTYRIQSIQPPTQPCTIYIYKIPCTIPSHTLLRKLWLFNTIIFL